MNTLAFAMRSSRRATSCAVSLVLSVALTACGVPVEEKAPVSQNEVDVKQPAPYVSRQIELRDADGAVHKGVALVPNGFERRLDETLATVTPFVSDKTSGLPYQKRLENAQAAIAKAAESDPTSYRIAIVFEETNLAYRRPVSGPVTVPKGGAMAYWYWIYLGTGSANEVKDSSPQDWCSSAAASGSIWSGTCSVTMSLRKNVTGVISSDQTISPSSPSYAWGQTPSDWAFFLIRQTHGASCGGSAMVTETNFGCWG